MGRSLGSGPATYLASRHAVGALVLISAFCSIRDAVRDKLGSLAAIFVKDAFNNLERIRRVISPVLIIHGKSDDFMPPKHSEKLYGIQTSNLDACPTICQLHVFENMTHSEMNFEDNLKTPLIRFLSNFGYLEQKRAVVKMPIHMFEGGK